LQVSPDCPALKIKDKIQLEGCSRGHLNSSVRRPDHYSRNAQDWKSLPAAGQRQIIVPNEKRHAGWVRQVATHQHHNAAAEV
jgi:hypothetical protein